MWGYHPLVVRIPALRDRVVPEWPPLHQELKKPGVTLSLLWLEYRAQHPSGYRQCRGSNPIDKYTCMATYISPEQRAKILSSIKDDGMSILDAATTYLVTEKTIRVWLRKQTRNAHTSSTEVQRLKQENQMLKEVIGEMILHQKMKKKSIFLST